MRGVRGGLGMSTVGANAVFAACTGTSIASASVFTRIAIPEMLRYGYSPRSPSAALRAVPCSAC